MSVEDLTESETSESMSYGIIERVADIKGVALHELAPLYSVIDPDALENLFNGEFENGYVEFSYEGCLVRVESNRNIIVVDSQSS